MTSEDEATRRTELALEAIAASLGTEASAFGAGLFATHHREELKTSYWLDRLQTETPDARQILSLLVLDSHWSEDDDNGFDTLDFILPGGVSNYVLSVRFDEAGAVEEICMES